METYTNPITKKKVIIYPFDLDEEMTWQEANLACKKLGTGWRLPTIEELKLIHSNLQKQNNGNLSKTKYWSSEVYGEYQNQKIFELIGFVWVIDKHGIVIQDTVTNKNKVRAVKDETLDVKKDKIVQYEYRCRKCFYGSNSPIITYFSDDEFPINDGHSEYYAVGKLKTSLNSNCNECGSSDIEYFDIRIDSKQLFDTVRFSEEPQDYFEIYISKENDKIEGSTSGARYLSNGFKENLIKKLSSLEDEILNNNESVHPFGNFHFGFRGMYNKKYQLVCRTERFLNAGIPAATVIGLLKQINDKLKSK